MAENKFWFRRHPIWTVIIVLVVIGFIGSLFSPSETSEKKEPQAPVKEEIKFSGSITDSSGDCKSSQSGEPITCKGAVDITSSTLNQENGLATVIINLAGNVPSASELKEGDILAESYQYQLWVKSNGKWLSVLFGDVRADTKKSEGGCGASYFAGGNIGSCDDSQVDFSIEGSKVTIKGPLQPKITNFRIKTLYESSSMDEDDIIDEVESG